MEKSVKDNPEYKMKRQGIIIGLVCLAVMVFLTIFLMSRYRQRTEKIFTELMEESLLSTHSEALTEMENFLAGSAGGSLGGSERGRGECASLCVQFRWENPGRRYADF